MLGLIVGIIIVPALLVLMVYITNRSRWTMEQAVLSGSSESELQELIQERWHLYRRKYIVFGPPSFDQYELAQSRADYPRLKQAKAEYDATIRKAAEDLTAQINESKRIYQEQVRLQQEELERMKRIHAEILKNLRMQLNLMPPDVAHALHVQGLPHDASFSDIRQSYRSLAKRSHPDTGGDLEQFKQINVAYTCLMRWIESQA
jgi:DNA-binding transcriptional regulator YiaG